MSYSVEARDVSFSYPSNNQLALDSVNLNIKKGECVLICGASGSGKTSFTRLLNGISPSHIQGDLTGKVSVYDLEAGVNPIEDYITKVGSVFQNPKNQHFATTTSDELALPLENTGVRRSEMKEIIDEISKFFEIEYLLDRDIFKLSGGGKQQVAFASACILKPDLLVLDEISSNLSPSAIERLRAMLYKIKEKDITIIITEHRLSWSKGLVDRYLFFDKGRLVKEWSSQELNEMTNSDLHKLGLRAIDLTDNYQKVEDLKVKRTSEDATLLLENLSIGYNKNKLVKDNINLAFEKGLIYGLLGENGIGKSTLASTLTGIIPKLSGDIFWKGQKASAKNLRELTFLVMQDVNYQLFSSSVEEEVLLSAKHPERMDEVLEKLGLSEYINHHPMS